ncbi:sodium-independent sulfate anion transporter [Lepeophtheirus salmonis]|uniref:sodium-independent sulfate anion transporter n=1 Tax=Lepeophtheirus salmonis TaxID=72036 RepID=UPI003AF3FA62
MSYNEDEELTESFIADHDVVFMEGSSRENAPKQASDYFAKDQKILSSSKIGCFLHQHVASLKKELSLKRIFPALEFMSNGYGSQSLFGDIVAGLTVTLTLIPMAISFAALAGLPLQYGLYSSILPGFIYAIFGHCPEISMGPTAVACILMHGYTDGDIQKSIALTFFYGGNTHIGRTIQSGISSQLCFSTGFGWFCIWDMLSSCFKSVNRFVGASGLNSDLYQAIKDMKCCQGTDKETKKYKTIEKIKWIVSVTRNSFVLILTSAIAYSLVNLFNFKDSLRLTGKVDSGLPEINLPWFYGLPSNSTNASGIFEIAQDLGTGIFTLPFINFVQAIAIVKHYSSLHPNRRVFPTQEMITLGCVNIFGSFIGSMPVTGSLSRSAVNAASGVGTTFSGVITSTLIIISCIFLTPLLAYIPRSALSAVVMSAIIFTFDIDLLLPLWRHRKWEMIPFLLTFFIGIFYKLQIGLLVGIVAHLFIILYASVTPVIHINHFKIQDSKVEYYTIDVDRSLYFTALDLIKTKIFNLIRDHETDKTLIIVLDVSQVFEMDYSVAKTLRSIEVPVKKSGGFLYFSGVQRSVEKVLGGVDPSPYISFKDREDIEIKLRAIHS